MVILLSLTRHSLASHAFSRRSSPVVNLRAGVGETFVNRYYHFLRNSPELVHRFYQESSRLGRADDHGNVTSVTTIDVGA
ncbi:hypothetical protein BHE74_00011529 [Ensete ventricosum]|nr:hypothetical protein BHE74_00011529 [Ensete ventricosum]